MVGLEQVELDHGIDQEESCTKHPPQGNMAWERFCDGGPSKLDADEELSDNDGNHHPRLSSKLVTIRIIK